jgi:hypothetical protein
MPNFARLIPERANKINPWLLLKAQCDFQTRSPDPAGRYGPEVPDADDRTRALIAMLHYEIPHAKDLPPGTVGAVERFCTRLNRGPTPHMRQPGNAVLAGGIAHDFNILTGILGNTSLALETLSANNPARATLRDVLNASERASHLTRQLRRKPARGGSSAAPRTFRAGT